MEWYIRSSLHSGANIVVSYQTEECKIRSVMSTALVYRNKFQTIHILFEGEDTQKKKPTTNCAFEEIIVSKKMTLMYFEWKFNIFGFAFIKHKVLSIKTFEPRYYCVHWRLFKPHAPFYESERNL